MINRLGQGKCGHSGKISHPSFHGAAKHAKEIAKQNRESFGELGIYKCPHCAAWHVGHKNKRATSRRGATP